MDTTEITKTERQEDEEISLIDLLAVLLHHKKMIMTITAVAAVFSIVFSIITIVLPPEKSPLPNKFTPKAEMLINDSSSSGAGLASMISSSGLGSLLGGSLGGGSSNSALAEYLIQSDSILDDIINKFNLIEKFEIKKSPITNSRKTLKKLLKAEYNMDNQIFTISMEDIDPVFACDVINYAVGLLEQKFTDLGIDTNLTKKNNLEENITSCLKEIEDLQAHIKGIESTVSNVFGSSVQSIALDATRLKLELEAQEQIYKQLKTQYELTKIEIESNTPVFQILEKAQVPDQKSGPSRGKLCIIITFAAGFMSVFIAFLLNAIENLKNDKEAMDKLRNAK